MKKNEIQKKLENLNKNSKFISEKTYTSNLIEKLKIKHNINDIDKIKVSYISNKKYELYQQEILKIKL